MTTTGDNPISCCGNIPKQTEDIYKKHLLEWEADEKVSPQSLTMDKWFKGEYFNWLPTKTQIYSSGFESILQGWLPDKPIIKAETRVIAMGSCFARYFILWLAENGYNKHVKYSPYNSLLRNGFGFESPAVIAQQLRWAFGDFDSRNALWIEKGQELFDATEERRELVRETLEQADILIITLGLSEVWYDQTVNEPLWRALPKEYYDPARHVFRVESCASTIGALEKIEEIRNAHLPKLKIIYTISPVRLKATFRPVSAFTANAASKAILRASVDEFLRNHWSLVNDTYFYYPSYEIVMEVLEAPFMDDNRHFYDYVPEKLMSLFARHYTECQANSAENLNPVVALPPNGGFLNVIAQLEAKNSYLQDECDKRLKVIEELDGEIKRRDASSSQSNHERPSLLKRIFKR